MSADGHSKAQPRTDILAGLESLLQHREVRLEWLKDDKTIESKLDELLERKKLVNPGRGVNAPKPHTSHSLLRALNSFVKGHRASPKTAKKLTVKDFCEKGPIVLNGDTIAKYGLQNEMVSEAPGPGTASRSPRNVRKRDAGNGIDPEGGHARDHTSPAKSSRITQSTSGKNATAPEPHQDHRESSRHSSKRENKEPQAHFAQHGNSSVMQDGALSIPQAQRFLGVSDAAVLQRLDTVSYLIEQLARALAPGKSFALVDQPDTVLQAVYERSLGDEPHQMFIRLCESIKVPAVEVMRSRISAWLLIHIFDSIAPWSQVRSDFEVPGNMLSSLRAVLEQGNIHVDTWLVKAQLHLMQDTTFQTHSLNEHCLLLATQMSMTLLPQIQRLAELNRKHQHHINMPDTTHWLKLMQQMIEQSLLLQLLMTADPEDKFQMMWFDNGAKDADREVELQYPHPDYSEVGITLMAGVKAGAGGPGDERVLRKATVCGQPGT